MAKRLEGWPFGLLAIAAFCPPFGWLARWPSRIEHPLREHPEVRDTSNQDFRRRNHDHQRRLQNHHHHSARQFAAPLKSGEVTWLAARTWFAGLEMVAIREAAARCQRLQRGARRKSNPVRFSRVELAGLTGLTPRAIAYALGQLRGCGVAEFATASIVIGSNPLPKAQEFIQELSGGRSVNRPVPVPRPVLRFLASQPAAALGKVMLGYICRGLSIARSGGTISSSGSVKATWLVEMLGLSERSVRYAQLELRSLGWIGKDTGSKQWKLNRDGAWFCINLEWTPVAGQGVTGEAGEGALKCPQIARPTPQSCTTVAPPKEDRKTPSESTGEVAEVSWAFIRELPPKKPAKLKTSSQRHRAIALLLALFQSLWLGAQTQTPINTGSDGHDGALNPTRDIAIDMADHPDGILRCERVLWWSWKGQRWWLPSRRPLWQSIHSSNKVSTQALKPNADWGEIEDRQRWLLIATLDRPFELRVPGVRCEIPVSAFLDPPDPLRDEADARRIARTIADWCGKPLDELSQYIGLQLAEASVV